MTDIAETEIISDPPFVALVDQGLTLDMPTDGAVEMTDYTALKVTAAGRARHLWQEIRAGVVVGMVDRTGKSATLTTAFEAEVIDGVLQDCPGSKGEDA